MIGVKTITGDILSYLIGARILGEHYNVKTCRSKEGEIRRSGKTLRRIYSGEVRQAQVGTERTFLFSYLRSQSKSVLWTSRRSNGSVDIMC